MRSGQQWRGATVEHIRDVAMDIREFEISVAGGVPAFDPGSHICIEVIIGDQPAIRSYSCVPGRAGRLTIAVKNHPNSRGGSRWMWSLVEGAHVRVTLPENRFELSWRASTYLLVAGGIGITPILGMAEALAEAGRPMRLVYATRARAQLAYGDRLRERLGERVEFFTDDETGPPDLGAAIDALPAEGELYICGPIGMLNAVKALWTDRGRPISRLRYEVFGDSGEHPELPFTVGVLNSDITVSVTPDKSLLDALTEAGIDMIWDCRRGECGLCAVDIVTLDGQTDHRDVFFSDAEKRENTRLCTCVSRLVGGHAVIDTGYRMQ